MSSCALAFAFLSLLRGRRAAGSVLWLARQAAQFGASVAAIHDQESNEGACACGIGAIGDRPALALAVHQAGTCENGDMGGQRIVRTAHTVGHSAGGKALWLLPHKQSEYR